MHSEALNRRRFVVHDKPMPESGLPIAPAAIEAPLAELRDEREHDRHDQNDAETDSQPRHPALEVALAIGAALESFEERDPGGDAAVPPRPSVRVEPVTARDVGEGVGENPDPDRAEDRLLTANRVWRQVVILIVVRRAIRQVTRDHLAAEHIRLPLESPGKLPEDNPEIQSQGNQEHDPLDHFTDDRLASRASAGPEGSIHGPAAGDQFDQNGEQAQASHEEKAEIEEMAVGDVADLVSEDGRDFERRQ